MLKHPSRVVLLFFLLLPVLLFLIVFSCSASLSGTDIQIPDLIAHLSLSCETETLP